MSAASNHQPAPLLSLRDVHKRFGGVHALRGVQLEVLPGEVHALVGENGAGKSTLLHILAGVHQPDQGEIEFNGQRNISMRSERASQDLGIAIVFQERSLFSDLTVAENIFAGRQPIKSLGRIDYPALHANAQALLERVGVNVSAGQPLRLLSPAQQQMVEIAKALSINARLILFDEPTAALTDNETRALFRVIEQLRREGVGIVYISHRLEEVFRIAQRVTVFRDGQWQGTLSVAETNTNDLVRRMVGRNVVNARQPRASKPGPVALQVRGLSDSTRQPNSQSLLRDISFEVRAGEILGFAGLAGAGRTEMALSVIGARPHERGEIFVDGKPVLIRSPQAAIATGIGYLPEDRKDAGLFLEMTIAENIASARLEEFGSWRFRWGHFNEVASRYRSLLRIASRGNNQPVMNLSGGNQQKVVLARWLLVNPKILIVDEPTRGVDVGAKSEVHDELRRLAEQGTAVILISSDLPEVLALSDRILVMREGRLTGELDGNEATEETVMRYASMSGAVHARN